MVAFRAFLKAFVSKEEFAAVLSELCELRSDVRHFRQETQERLEQIDRRFEQHDQRLEAIDRQFAALRQMIADEHDSVEVAVGGLQRRSGRKLEDVVAGALRVALRRPDIKPDQLWLRP